MTDTRHWSGQSGAEASPLTRRSARPDLAARAATSTVSRPWGFHAFFEWEGYYGEQRYDDVEARYDPDGEAGDDGVAVAGEAGGEAAQFGVAGVAGAVDPDVEVLAECRNQL